MSTFEPDYLEMWRSLAERGRARSPSGFSYFDNKQKAEQFDMASRKKNSGKRDTLLDFVRHELRPGDTVLDVGAGTGRWSIPLATAASRVTAVEPARSMSAVLVRNAADAGVLDRIVLVQ